MRIGFIKLLFLLLLFGIMTRLFYWQVVRADELKAMAEGQHFENLQIPATRGDIKTSDGFSLATSRPNFLLYALPKTLTEQEKKDLATILAKLLSLGEKEYEETLKKEFSEKIAQNLYWVSLVKSLNFDMKNRINSLKLKGIGFSETSSRFYPEGSSSAQLLGFVGSNQRGEDTGYFGLEGFYNGELKGVAGNIRQERDALGLPIIFGQLLGTFKKDGKGLQTNIDRSVQFIVEQTLKRDVEKYGAKAASAIVMDPETGAILAMASYPSYDPANFTKYPKEYYRNPVVADSYEPGSTFKVLVMAAAINEDLVEPDTKCDNCSGPISLGGFNIRTWNNQYKDSITMTETIIHSDNTGMVFAGKKLGIDKLYSYLENFGMGSNTNIDLQDESSADMRPKKEWKEIDLATASFGQGILVTPIQMIRAVATIANGGKLVEPQIAKIIEGDNSNFEIKPKVVREVIRSDTAKILTEMMVKAVDEGEAKFAKPKGFKIAGKTGTAQIPIAGHYDPNKTIASFVGFAPADNPKFVMLVRFDQPTASIYGSETAAPTFFAIAKQLFPYFKIAPTNIN